ncbi:hypothetical protein [Brevibacterium sp. S111]|uniref:hypothetical protein n=1 Tax=Brevibacterium sp. S111 TaxID=2483795 RepID=UPI0010822921|nr:hypothetical protein [Brevibacterium sp. S111]TGD11652.1 hypothetical protein EB836_07270 [Brevibacterium sp. S111]
MTRPAARAMILPACLLTLASLTACTGLDENSASTDPRPVHSPAETLDPAEPDDPGTARAGDSETGVVDPGWVMAAQEADGVFLSLHEKDSDLEFRAVDSAGTILWTALRPRVCSGFFVSESEAGPVAVLMDQQSGSNSSLATTASGFDLHTGRKLWGPVEAPGPLLGSGLVFAGAPQDFIGKGGPRVALDPATGKRLAAEAEDSPRVITLLGSHLILADGEMLIGQDLGGHRLWIRDAADLGVSAGEARETPWEAIGGSHALLGSAGDRQRTLIDLRSGAAVASNIDSAGYDAGSHTLITADAQLHGFDLDGTKRWDAPLADDAELSAVGDGRIVTAAGAGNGPNGTETRSASDGQTIDGAEDDPATRRFGAAHHIAETGARLFGDPDSPLLSPKKQ